jgi:hypothetical protein
LLAEKDSTAGPLVPVDDPPEPPEPDPVVPVVPDPEWPDPVPLDPVPLDPVPPDADPPAGDPAVLPVEPVAPVPVEPVTAAGAVVVGGGGGAFSDEGSAPDVDDVPDERGENEPGIAWLPQAASATAATAALTRTAARRGVITGSCSVAAGSFVTDS